MVSGETGEGLSSREGDEEDHQRGDPTHGQSREHHENHKGDNPRVNQEEHIYRERQGAEGRGRGREVGGRGREGKKK